MGDSNMCGGYSQTTTANNYCFEVSSFYDGRNLIHDCSFLCPEPCIQLAFDVNRIADITDVT